MQPRRQLYQQELTGQILGAAIEVHKQLGPGLLESTYQACLCHELELRGISFECQKPLPLEYKGIKLECGYRIDLLVAGLVVVEIKSVEALAPIHEVKVRWNDPHGASEAGRQVYDSMFPIVESAYHARGGKSPHLPGRAELIKGGRADVRFAIDAAGELYLYSKGDGIIRKVAGASGF